jgi:hypothetical protein
MTLSPTSIALPEEADQRRPPARLGQLAQSRGRRFSHLMEQRPLIIATQSRQINAQHTCGLDGFQFAE